MSTVVLSSLLLCGLAQVPQTDPGSVRQPSPTPISWEFEFRFLDPRRIDLPVPGTDRTEVYWYVVYRVTNPTPRTQRFYPLFQIVTEELELFNTETGIHPYVVDAIRERHKLTHPYLIHPTQAIGDLRSGADNAVDSVAIWKEIDLTQNSFRVYVGGLSGELQYVQNRAYDPDQPETIIETSPGGEEREVVVNPKFFTLRKTLEIRYTLPGSPTARTTVLPEREGVRWMMR